MAVNVKFTFADETRRVTLPRSDAPLDDLRGRVATALSLADPAMVRLSYVDDDGDNIVIETDAELNELLNNVDSIRLTVTLRQVPADHEATAGSQEQQHQEQQQQQQQPASTNDWTLVSESSSPASEPATKEAAAPAEPAATAPASTGTDLTASSSASSAAGSSSSAAAASASATTTTTPTPTPAAPVRMSADISRELQNVLDEFEARNQDVFERVTQLRRELQDKLAAEREERRRAALESRRKLWDDLLSMPNGVRSRTVQTSVVNGAQTTVVREVDEHGTETVTTYKPDGSKAVAVNKLLQNSNTPSQQQQQAAQQQTQPQPKPAQPAQQQPAPQQQPSPAKPAAPSHESRRRQPQQPQQQPPHHQQPMRRRASHQQPHHYQRYAVPYWTWADDDEYDYEAEWAAQQQQYERDLYDAYRMTQQYNNDWARPRWVRWF